MNANSILLILLLVQQEVNYVYISSLMEATGGNKTVPLSEISGFLSVRVDLGV